MMDDSRWRVREQTVYLRNNVKLEFRKITRHTYLDITEDGRTSRIHFGPDGGVLSVKQLPFVPGSAT